MKGIVNISVFVLLSFVLNMMPSKASQDEANVQELTYIPTFDDHRNSSFFQKFVDSNTKDTPIEEKNENLKLAGGMVSIDCLRCLCLKQSNCKPFGCEMENSLLKCGYFKITQAKWIDCGMLGSDWKKCANDITCSSQCVQNYMKRYAQHNNCPLKCNGYSRELFGGPNGCNNPRTIPFWNAVQNVPGCKGVE